MEAGEVMADAGVLGFCQKGDLFGLAEQVFRDDLAVNFPAIGKDGEESCLVFGDHAPEDFGGFGTTRAHRKGKEPSGAQRHSSPYPELALFFWV